MARRCPDCGQPMTKYATGWKCMNVKAHAKSRRGGSRGNNPRGINQTAPRKPRGRKGRFIKTTCPACENGKRFNPKRCTLCGKRGWIWSIKE